mmetsp:Transcript_5086/g.9978  ORF Transcript_5086/g.9978 Transcript_5086/m.9978 type:complete len:95 (+) Transcript_5086:1587-1871(+)
MGLTDRDLFRWKLNTRKHRSGRCVFFLMKNETVCHLHLTFQVLTVILLEYEYGAFLHVSKEMGEWTIDICPRSAGKKYVLCIEEQIPDLEYDIC